jgi:hypothetical protein
MNLLTGIKNHNYKLVNKALYELYQQKKNISFFKNGEWLPEFLEAPELVTNTSAILLQGIHKYDTELIVFYVRNWLKKASELSKESIENILNLYAITTEKVLSFWDVDAKQIARIMHPDKTALLLEMYDEENETHPLLLNFHIATIHYYSHVRDLEKLNYAFDFITEYYKEKVLTIDDRVKLALFLNYWSSYSASYEMLLKSFHQKTINKEGAFILAQLVMFAEVDPKITKRIMKKAYKYDAKRWCNWIQRDFQILRNSSVKALYCAKCSE